VISLVLWSFTRSSKFGEYHVHFHDMVTFVHCHGLVREGCGLGPRLNVIVLSTVQKLIVVMLIDVVRRL
jgi:hypothetical protein